ncbi:MAG: Protein containing Heat shock protein Hsp20 protein [Parcubacteria group bacterium GW2011_GWA2_36_10]|nr:MAG: Protein containing Heat shock protein Hsp20 protein [Parcubacteria group bacterium GW2011_GWA2_36_10]
MFNFKKKNKNDYAELEVRNLNEEALRQAQGDEEDDDLEEDATAERGPAKGGKEADDDVVDDEEEDEEEGAEDVWEEMSEEIEEEGQLAVDVYQDKKNIIIKSTIAGVEPDDIDISIDNDMITIRGRREKQRDVAEDDYFYQECYWGGFSRSIILPVEVDAEGIEASMRNGVLTITLPKMHTKDINIKVKDEN